MMEIDVSPMKFARGKATLVAGMYANDRIALKMYQKGEPLCVPSVNLPNTPLGENEIFIKNWSENEGVLEALVKAGIVEDTGQTVPTGFVEANVCRLLIDPATIAE